LLNRAAPPLIMSATQRSTLLALTRSASTPVRQLVRARALLLAADGVANDRIAADLTLSATTVRSWRARFVTDGLAQLGRVRPGQGTKPSVSADTVRAIVHATTHTKPPDQPQWSCQTMAAEFGVSAATVYRIWRANGLKPHILTKADSACAVDGQLFHPRRAGTPTTPPGFGADDKRTDVVGVILTPSVRAIAICMDETSRLQAVERAARADVYTGRRPELITHGGRRNTTTTLFAALEVLTGAAGTPSGATGLVGARPGGGASTYRRRTPHDDGDEDFLQFLATIDESVPTHLAVHVVMDNCITHRHAEVQRWLDRHRRFHLLFAPAADSWLELAESWMWGQADTAPRGSFNSVPELIATIEGSASSAETVAPERGSVSHRSTAGFVWTATTDSILGRVRGVQHVLRQAVGQ
jgi:transposase